jgi:hypothetical protein
MPIATRPATARTPRCGGWRAPVTVAAPAAVDGTHRAAAATEPSVYVAIAAEVGGAYETGSPEADRAGCRADRSAQGQPTPDPADGAAPFGLPVLAELPELAGVLADLEAADRAQRSAVLRLAKLLEGDEVERTTGVGADHWLAAVARLTRMDRRLLVRTCRLLHRLPALASAVEDGRVSFAQLRGLCIALRQLRRELDGPVDRLIGALLTGLDRFERPDPDVLVRQVTDGLDELDPGDLAERERDARAGRFLALQPRLDGTGGDVAAGFDALGFALLDVATEPTPAQIAAAGGVGAARADLLLARLAASASDTELADLAATASTAGRGDHLDGGGRAEDAVPAVAEDAVPSVAEDAARPDLRQGDGREGDGREGDRLAGDRLDGVVPWWEQLPPPQVRLRLRFESLLDPAVPAELLTALVGGRLKLTSHAARRLVDERGALLRAVVVDDTGEVLGVGRTTRRPPDWARDAIAALHDTCTGPCCDRPARSAQTDHAAPWWPVRPDQSPGRTDLDELGPLCDTTNRAKEAAGWRVDQTAAGVRTWRHERTGLACTTVPSTWRPPDDPRLERPPQPAPGAGRGDGCRHHRPPTSTDPPGHPATGPSTPAPDPPSTRVGEDDPHLPF